MTSIFLDPNRNYMTYSNPGQNWEPKLGRLPRKKFVYKKKIAFKSYCLSIAYAQTKACFLFSVRNAQENANKETVVDKDKKSVEVTDEEDVPSDLAINHHPHRTCQYSITYAGSGEKSNNAETDITSKWDIDNLCISDLCYSLKQTTSRVVDNINPAQISDIHTCPPVDWLLSLTLCAEFLTEACKSGNVLDVHTAQVLTQILLLLNNSPMDVYGLSGSAKCVVLIAEFKHKNQNSYIESDLVKLGKQMKITLNLLIKDGVKKPKVCGIRCEGEEVYTFIMDIPSPKLYRMCNVSKIKLFKNLDQISLLPSILSHLLHLKTIACETASKMEEAILYKYDNLKRPSPNPPTDWISSSSVTVNVCLKNKQKKSNFSSQVIMNYEEELIFNK
ncbi:uncharacterized protein EV154DRAFT_546712 [Mucor mucedo]|uniref:uncharacterized protein n=1 Tax=Mucor mucedo TaxID=29922 RepID=UPI0022208239|nr:uncharacterized protein EV154DRAFT_546712 [Mucor mucedo]KAI7897300.1 hypothetical protein EV154DRAFT_546712 [Mucor mucedo]